MPVFFICFIVFVIWFYVKSNHEDKTKDTWDKDFWEKEHEADFAPKKDISDIEYISVQKDLLPFNNSPDEEEKELQDKILELADAKLLNLSDMTNTDIKLKYGRANFDYLSCCDQNFLLLLRLLNQWGSYIYNTLKDRQRAKKVFEYSINLGSDISETYITLAQIYIDENRPEQIQELITKIENSDFFMKESIKLRLIKLFQEY